MPSTASFWSIINNVYDSSANALRMSLSFTHDHSSGSGGLLDWDVVWGDAVHSHGTNTEGGTLDVAAAVPNAVPKNTLTTLGDIPYATGSATWSRLAAGSLNYVLTSNGIGSAASYQAVSAAISAGSYTGDAGTGRAIAHSLGKTPLFVKIQNNSAVLAWEILGGTLFAHSNTTDAVYAITNPDSTNFYVGTGNAANTGNGSGEAYRWVSQG